MALERFRAPALPIPNAEYDQRTMTDIIRALRLYFNQLDSLTPNQAQSYRADNFYGGEFDGTVMTANNVATSTLTATYSNVSSMMSQFVRSNGFLGGNFVGGSFMADKFYGADISGNGNGIILPSASFQDNTNQFGSTVYPSPISFTQVDYTNQIILDDTTASFTGARTATTLTVSAITGTLTVGSHLFGTGYETAVVTGSVTNNVLNVTAVTSGTLTVGNYLTGVIAMPAGTRIAALLTGSGGVGTYLLNVPDGSTFSIASTTVTAYGVYITNQLTGTLGAAGTYSTSTSGNLASRAMTSRQTSRIRTLVAGVYSLTWSGQFSNLANAAEDINVWIRINNVDFPGTNGVVSLQARKSVGVPTKVIAGWNYFINLNANDYVEFWWLPASTDVSLAALPAVTGTPTAYPSTASMIATVGFVSGLSSPSNLPGFIKIAPISVTGFGQIGTVIVNTTNTI
jgi:hypothetical protein